MACKLLVQRDDLISGMKTFFHGVRKGAEFNNTTFSFDDGKINLRSALGQISIPAEGTWSCDVHIKRGSEFKKLHVYLRKEYTAPVVGIVYDNCKFRIAGRTLEVK